MLDSNRIQQGEQEDKENTSKINQLTMEDTTFNKIKIATLNLCLGIQAKKNLIKETIKTEKIDILCMQEIEVKNNLDCNLLSFPGYSIEVEKNTKTARVGFYINNKVNYLRRKDLEGDDSNLIIIDLEGDTKARIINIYRSFTPQHNLSQRDKFRYQLGLIRTAFTRSAIILGDFNLDWNKHYDMSYSHSNYFHDMEELLGDLDLIQTVNFNTWSRTINNVVKVSILDHVHLVDPYVISYLTKTWTSFSDHCLVSFMLDHKKTETKTSWRRDWRRYTKEDLNTMLKLVVFSLFTWQIYVIYK